MSEVASHYVLNPAAQPIGHLHIKTTAAETAASVTPVNFQYEPGNVLRYGTNTTPGTTDMTTAIQAALDAMAGTGRVFIPRGTYLVSSTIRIPGESYVHGDGRQTDGTIIKMLGTVGRDTNLIQIGTRDDPSNNVVLEHILIDFNSDRWLVSGGTNDGEDMHGTAVGVYGSQTILLKDLQVSNGYKHCIDVSAPSYQRGQGNATTYDDQPSAFVWLERCSASGAGDDNITTHQSTHIWITDCYSSRPSGVRTPNNSNCVEIDDGSRNVFIRNLISRGGVRGLEIKAHDAPAPYNVHVQGYVGINNCRGLEVRHLGHHSVLNLAIIGVSTGSKTFTVDDDFTDSFDEDNTFIVSGSTGNDGTYTVVSVALNSGDTVITVSETIPNATADGNIIQSESVTAFDLFFDDITIVAPKRLTSAASNPGDVSRAAIALKAYSRVKFGKVLITDGSQDLDNLEYAETDMDSNSDSMIRMFLHARDVSFDELIISGFSDVPRGFYASGSSPGGIYIGRLVGRDSPGSVEFFRASGDVDNVFLMSYDIEGNHAGTSGSIGVRMSDPVSGTNRKYVGPGVVTGYETAIVWNSESYASGIIGLSGPLVIPTFSETATGTFTCAVDGPQTTVIDSSAGAVTATLPDGLADGQRKKITMSDASNSSTVSVTSHETSSPEVFTFAQVTDVLILEWDASNEFWWTVKNLGAAT